MACWLVKEEPDNYSHAHFLRERRVVRAAVVSRRANPDPTAVGEGWSAVDLQAGAALSLDEAQNRWVLELGGLSAGA